MVGVMSILHTHGEGSTWEGPIPAPPRPITWVKAEPNEFPWLRASLIAAAGSLGVGLVTGAVAGTIAWFVAGAAERHQQVRPT